MKYKLKRLKLYASQNLKRRILKLDMKAKFLWYNFGSKCMSRYFCFIKIVREMFKQGSFS